MDLELITLDGVKLNEQIYEVSIPTVDGPIGVFPGHMPLVTLANNGVVSVRRKKSDPDSAMDHFATYGGVVEINPTKVRILVDEADTADEIIAEEAEAALGRAQRLKAEAKNAVDLKEAQELLDRSAVRLKVANLRRRHYKG